MAGDWVSDEPIDVLSAQMLMAGFGYPRIKGVTGAKVLGEVGELEGEEGGAKVTLLPHYLLIEVNTAGESGELWLPITTLLTLIGEMQQNAAN